MKHVIIYLIIILILTFPAITEENIGTVYVIRPFSIVNCLYSPKIKVYIDQTPAVELNAMEFTKIRIKEGDHLFYIGMGDSGFSDDYGMDALLVNVKSGQIVYIEVTPQYLSCPKINIVEKTDENSIKQFKRVKNRYYSVKQDQ